MKKLRDIIPMNEDDSYLKETSPLRNIKKMQTVNDGSRNLYESVMSPEVIKALEDWKKGNGGGTLIGGLAHSFYAKPRFTQDVDVLYKSGQDVPESVTNFKKHRVGAFEHKATGVEVETVHPDSINMHPKMAEHITNNARESNGLRVAAPEGIVASKLGRNSLQDKADIHDIIHSGHFDEKKLMDHPLTDEHKKRYESIKENK